jgi:hypothetical protein
MKPTAMTADKTTSLVLEALKSALAEPGEHRLYRAGKSPGLFAGRTGVQGEAAARALADGLLELVRSETKGKSAVDWVRVTPRGVEFVTSRESPIQAMNELRNALQATSAGLPSWMATIRQALQEIGDRLVAEMHSVAARLERLSDRIGAELLRAEQAGPKAPAETTKIVPWAQSVIDYLERRRQGGVTKPCPLPELFLAVRHHDSEITVNDYHAGLRRMSDRGLVRLIAFEGPGELPEPEYALLEGAAVYYYVSQNGRDEHGSPGA